MGGLPPIESVQKAEVVYIDACDKESPCFRTQEGQRGNTTSYANTIALGTSISGCYLRFPFVYPWPLAWLAPAYTRLGGDCSWYRLAWGQAKAGELFVVFILMRIGWGSETQVWPHLNSQVRSQQYNPPCCFLHTSRFLGPDHGSSITMRPFH